MVPKLRDQGMSEGKDKARALSYFLTMKKLPLPQEEFPVAVRILRNSKSYQIFWGSVKK
jgi:hypothetical protein